VLGSPLYVECLPVMLDRTVNAIAFFAKMLPAFMQACRLSLLCTLSMLSQPSEGLDFSMNPLLIQWQFEQSIFECRMFHSLDNYGLIEFYHRAGEDLVFVLKPTRQLMKPGQAAVHIEPPAWRPSNYSEALGFVEIPRFEDEQYPITSATQANRMMIGLRQGLQPTITRRAYFDDRTPIRVKVNPAQFSVYYPTYLECTSKLLPVNYDQIKRSKILFKSGQERMDPKDAEWMTKVALYINNDPKVTAIYIDGHSDNVGRRYHNRRLSETRAFGVHEFLINQGVNSDLITVRYHGDRYPVASNRTKAGRAQNRRVTVRVERADQVLEPDITDDAKSDEDNQAAGRPVIETLDNNKKEEQSPAQDDAAPRITPLNSINPDSTATEAPAASPVSEADAPEADAPETDAAQAAPTLAPLTE
jgi:outer membrane protein OmpA-like peptidoglycan-associated protein